eukprot:IDg2968t1
MPQKQLRASRIVANSLSPSWVRLAENRAASSSICCRYNRRSAPSLCDSPFTGLPVLGRALPLLVFGFWLFRALYGTLNQDLRCYRSSSPLCQRYRYRDTVRRRKRHIPPVKQSGQPEPYYYTWCPPCPDL